MLEYFAFKTNSNSARVNFIKAGFSTVSANFRSLSDTRRKGQYLIVIAENGEALHSKFIASEEEIKNQYPTVIIHN